MPYSLIPNGALLTDTLPLSTQVHSISGRCVCCDRKNDHQAIYVSLSVVSGVGTWICSYNRVERGGLAAPR